MFSAPNRRGSLHAINFTVPLKEFRNPTRAAEINIILNYFYWKKSLSNRPTYFDLKLGHLQALNLYKHIQEVKVKQSRYRPGVAQRVPGS